MTEKGPQSVWAAIQSPPQIPVIADGLFQHYTRPAQPQTYETDIQLPNINCAKCTLQIIQFMAEHGYNQPGGYSYHHCADLADHRRREPSRSTRAGLRSSRLPKTDRRGAECHPAILPFCNSVPFPNPTRTTGT